MNPRTTRYLESKYRRLDDIATWTDGWAADNKGKTFPAEHIDICKSIFFYTAKQAPDALLDVFPQTDGSLSVVVYLNDDVLNIVLLADKTFQLTWERGVLSSKAHRENVSIRTPTPITERNVFVHIYQYIEYHELNLPNARIVS